MYKRRKMVVFIECLHPIEEGDKMQYRWVARASNGRLMANGRWALNKTQVKNSFMNFMDGDWEIDFEFDDVRDIRL